MAALLPLLVACASLAGLAQGQWVAADSTGGADVAARLCGELELCTSSNYTWAPVAAAARGPEEACALLQQKGLKTLRLFGDSFGAPPPLPGQNTELSLSKGNSGACSVCLGYCTSAIASVQRQRACNSGMLDMQAWHL